MDYQFVFSGGIENKVVLAALSWNHRQSEPIGSDQL
jgi:hypothetical protein